MNLILKMPITTAASNNFDFFMSLPFSMGGRGWGGQVGAYSITAVRTYIRPVPSNRSIHNTNGFRAISLKRIGILD